MDRLDRLSRQAPEPVEARVFGVMMRNEAYEDYRIPLIHEETGDGVQTVYFNHAK